MVSRFGLGLRSDKLDVAGANVRVKPERPGSSCSATAPVITSWGHKWACGQAGTSNVVSPNWVFSAARHVISSRVSNKNVVSPPG